MNDQPVDMLKEEREAIERLAATPDGRLLHRYLRREVEDVSADTSHGALAMQNGRRSLARNLMTLMVKGIENSRDVALASRPTGPTRIAGARGPGRRVSFKPAGDPWNAPDPTDDAGSGNAA